MAGKLAISIPVDALNKEKLEIDDALAKVIRLGNDQITNLKILPKLIEMRHRMETSQMHAEFQDRLLEDRLKVFNKLDELEKSWTELDEMTEIVSLHDNIAIFKNDIANLLGEKDLELNLIMNDILLARKNYDKQLLMQEENIITMAERLGRHVRTVRTAYHDKTLLFNEIVERTKTEWSRSLENMSQDMMKHRNDDEHQQLIIEKCMQNSRDDWMVIANAQEQMTMLNTIHLERDRDQLQMDFERLRVDISISVEHLINKYKILKLREEENKHLLHHQKRNNAAVIQSIVRCEGKIKSQIGEQAAKIRTLSDKVISFHRQIRETRIKDGIRKQSFNQKLMQIWKMNETDAIQLYERLQNVDQIIHEHILGVELKSKPAKKMTDATPRKLWQNYNHIKIADTFEKDVLQELEDSCDYVIDENVYQIILKHTLKDRSLVKVQTICDVLNIKDKQNLWKLLQIFKKYSFCLNCADNLTHNPQNILYKEFTRLDDNSKMHHQDQTSCNNHELSVEPAFVMIVLREFVASHNKSKADKNWCKPSKESYDTLNTFYDVNKLATFWKQFHDYKAPGVVDYLKEGLQTYLKTLKRRQTLEQDCRELRKQNEELQYALKNFS